LSATARYTQGLGIDALRPRARDFGGRDEPLEVQIGRGTYYYHADALGSVVAVTKSNGSVANSYTYVPFGSAYPASQTVANPFEFTGREWDSETSLYYYRARYYDPLWGRFLSEDPDRLSADINFYRYVGNSPANWEDPSGLKVFKCCRDLEVNWFINGVAKALRVKHCFIKTDSKEAGMGPAGGGPLPSSPCYGTQTAITDQTGRAAKSDCKEVSGVNEACVNQQLMIGKPTGKWSSSNNCNTLVDQVLDKCKEKGQCPLQKLEGPPFFIPIMVM
jgi:RHS repeat-associated protein